MSVAATFDTEIKPFLSGSLSHQDTIAFWISWSQWKNAHNELRRKGYVFTDAPANLELYTRFLDNAAVPITRIGITDAEWDFMLNLLARSDEELKDRWNEFSSGKLGTMSLIYTSVSGFLYGIARVTILGLAFAALRKQDAELYTDTWTRYLPSIG